MEQVVLVDEADNAIGVMEKMEAHQKGVLHRAFSIFIFNTTGEMLLQQRALSKYHSGGLWTNACCSHPKPEELVENAALRRLQEEMGFTTTLQKTFAFTYKANFSNNLTEYEYDHVYVGEYAGSIIPNEVEVATYKYVSKKELLQDVALNSSKYTAWFLIALPKLMEWWNKNY